MRRGYRFAQASAAVHLVATALTATAAFGQLSSTVSLSNGVQLQVAADLGHPTGEEKLTAAMSRASGNSFYRIFRDQNNLVVFVYELMVDRSSDGTEMHFTARPAGDEFAARFPHSDGGKPAPTLSTDREFRPLHAGEKETLGLFEIPGMGLAVSDSVAVLTNEAADNPPPATAGSLHFSGLKVTVNSESAIGPAAGTVSGRYAMFYLPGRGGYFFSLEAPVGDAPGGRAFVKTGSVEGTRLRFTIDNEAYECDASAPILGSSSGAAASGDVWVWHDPNYKPAGNWTRNSRADEPSPTEPDEFFTAASDSLSWWLP